MEKTTLIFSFKDDEVEFDVYPTNEAIIHIKKDGIRFSNIAIIKQFISADPLLQIPHPLSYEISFFIMWITKEIIIEYISAIQLNSL